VGSGHTNTAIESVDATGRPLQVVLGTTDGKSTVLSWDGRRALLQLEGTEPRVLLPRTHFALRSAGLLAELEIAEASYRIPRHKLSSALEIVGLCRIGQPDPEPAADPPLCGSPSRTTRAGLFASCGGHEPLAWLQLRAAHEGESRVLGAWKKPWWLVLTEDSTTLVAVSDAGDVATRTMTEKNVVADAGKWRVGDLELKSPASAADVKLVAEAASQSGTSRRLQLARSMWLRDRAAHGAWVRQQLRATANDDSDAALLCLALVPEDPQDPTAPPQPPQDHQRLARLWNDWQLSAQEAQPLFRRLPLDPAWAPSALLLSEQLTALPSKPEDIRPQHISLRLAHCERLFRWDEHTMARTQLGELSQLLPPATLADVDLPTDLPRSPWYEVRLLQTRLRHDLAADANERERAALARLTLAPLDDRALRDVQAAANDPALLAAAREVHHVLRDPGSAAGHSSAEVRSLDALTPEELQQLVHPLLRREEKLLFRVGKLAAKPQRPDFATLKLYCERVTESDSMVASVTDEAATLLGLGHVDVFVSRGHDDVGLRSFASDTNVLLVGGQHLDTRSRYYMTPSELSFSIASELAHLRLEHPRLAPSDVTRGVIDKSRQALDITLSLLPVVAGLKLADRLGMITAKLSLPQVSRVASAVRNVSATLNAPSKDPQRSDLGQANEQLLEASRFAQLTADRAGLVATGDLTAALRAMLLSRTDYIRVATRLENLSLLTAIEQQRGTSPAAFDDLLVRVGFLVDFYLGDSYRTLRRAASRSPVR